MRWRPRSRFHGSSRGIPGLARHVGPDPATREPLRRALPDSRFRGQASARITGAARRASVVQAGAEMLVIESGAVRTARAGSCESRQSPRRLTIGIGASVACSGPGCWCCTTCSAWRPTSGARAS